MAFSRYPFISLWLSLFFLFFLLNFRGSFSISNGKDKWSILNNIKNDEIEFSEDTMMIFSEFKNNNSKKNVKITLMIKDESIEMNLIRNDDLFASSYKEVYMNEDGNVLSERKLKDIISNCHYKGDITGLKSSVRASLCFGALYANIIIKEKEGIHLNIEPILMEDKNENIQKVETEKRKYTHKIFHSHKSSRITTPTCGVKHEFVSFGERGYNVQDAGECNNSPTKYLQMLIINDKKRYDRLGSDTGHSTVRIFNFEQGYYDDASFSCKVHLVLAGQVFWSQGNPSGVTFRPCNTPDPDFQNGLPLTDICCNDNYDDWLSCNVNLPVCLKDTKGQDPNTPACWNVQRITQTWGSKQRIMYTINSSPSYIDSDKSTEIDTSQLLNSFGKYARIDQKTNLENIFGEYDNVHLFTAEDFDSSTVGLAPLGSMCGERSVSVVMSNFASDGYVAGIAAHELGHNFALTHDDSCDSNKHIMASSGSSSNVITTFSTCSVSQMNDFFIQEYTGSMKCLDNVVGSVCGNGIVEQGEYCDDGLSEDSCCVNCQKDPGCECLNSQKCCSNGKVRTDSYVCRASQSSECDYEEICDGKNADCPNDYFKTPGIDCGSNGGKCYQGKCISGESQCQEQVGRSYCHFGDLTCSERIYCKSVTPGYCSTSGATTFLDGGPCPDGSVAKQCFGGSCVLSSSIYTYYWKYSEWSTCSNSQQSRTVTCVDQEQTEVSSSKCSPNSEPLTRSCSSGTECDGVTCNGHGSCISADLCQCESGYAGNLCEFYFKVSDWGVCDALYCNATGTSSRQVQCVSVGDVTVSETNCNSLVKPISTQSCSKPGCSESSNNDDNSAVVISLVIVACVISVSVVSFFAWKKSKKDNFRNSVSNLNIATNNDRKGVPQSETTKPNIQMKEQSQNTTTPTNPKSLHQEMVQEHFENQSIPAPWIQYETDDGTPYYFNPETNQSVWEKPIL